MREAARQDVMLLLVTACPPPEPSTRTTDERLATMVRAFDGLRAAIARARAALPDGVPAPVIGTEVVPVDPVTASTGVRPGMIGRYRPEVAWRRP
jgi:hypothetical protein